MNPAAHPDPAPAPAAAPPAGPSQAQAQPHVPARARLPIATLLCVYAGDRAELFSAALQSIIDQTLGPEIESRIYLGVDGPLPPALADAVQAVEGRLFQVTRSPARQGLAATLNGLLERLQDEPFVFRMDADDVALPQRYARQLAHMLLHPDIDVLGTAITEFDELTGAERTVRFASGPEDALAQLHRRVPVAHPTVCIRRRVFDRLPRYPENGSNEDLGLWFACALQGFRFDNLPESLLRYRISASFWQRRSLEKAGSELRCYLRGIYALRGPWTLAYAFPLLRFALRLMPTPLARWAYNSARLRGGAARP